MENADSLIRLAVQLHAHDVDHHRLLADLGRALAPEDDPPQTLCDLLRGRLPRTVPRAASPSRGELVAVNVMLCSGELDCAQAREVASAVWLDRLAPRALAAAADRLVTSDQAAAMSLARAAARRAADIVTVGRVRRVLAAEQTTHDTSVRIAVIGNCTLRPLADALEVTLLGNGRTADVWEAPFDQWATQVLDPHSALWQRDPAFVVVYLSSLGLTRSATDLSFDLLDTVRDVLRAIAGRASTRLLLVLPEPLEEEATTGMRARSWRTEFTRSMRDAAGDRALVIDPIDTVAAHHSRLWFAARFWHTAKLPCHPDALVQLGGRLARTVSAAMSRRVKAIAVDLDNTLWGGTVGEDGWQGIDLDVHARGAAPLRLQAFLRELRSRGILLIALSKNDESAVREVFERRPEMLLRLDDFAVKAVNWRPKSENLVEAARQLNIGLRDVCVIDDSAFERAQIRHLLPEVIVPELPEEGGAFVSHLARSGLFDIPVVTDEDRRRAELYQIEHQRAEAAKGAPDLETFLKDLQLNVQVEPIGDENLERCTQLINKTNQFNVTTRRHDRAQVRQFASDPRVYAYAHRSRDRFGDQGLVGVLIAVPTDVPAEYRVDTWVLSCRVMGRTVEHAMFDHLLAWLSSCRAARLVGEYIPTSRNAPVAGLYTSFGFQRRDDPAGRYERDVTTIFTGNRFASVHETVSMSETA